MQHHFGCSGRRFISRLLTIQFSSNINRECTETFVRNLLNLNPRSKATVKEVLIAWRSSGYVKSFSLQPGNASVSTPVCCDEGPERVIHMYLDVKHFKIISQVLLYTWFHRSWYKTRSHPNNG